MVFSDSCMVLVIFGWFLGWFGPYFCLVSRKSSDGIRQKGPNPRKNKSAGT